VDDTGCQSRDDRGDVPLDARLRACGTGIVHPDVFQPGLGFVGRFGRVLADLRVLRRDPSDHDHDYEDGKRDGAEQNERRSGRAWDSVSRQPANDRRSDRRHDCRDHEGPDNRLRRPEQPDNAGKEEEQPDEEPRSPPQISQPSRRREDRRELACFERAELDRRRLCRLAGPVSLEEVS
jgi:hypothetical protein